MPIQNLYFTLRV